MVYSGRHGLGLVRIQQTNSPYQTNKNKSIISSSIYTLIPLTGKVVLATQTCRVKKGNYVHARVHAHARNPPNPEALSPDIE